MRDDEGQIVWIRELVVEWRDVPSLLSWSQYVCIALKKNSTFFIRDNRLKKGGGDLNDKGDRRNLCAKKPLIIMMMTMKMRMKMVMIWMIMIMVMLLLLMLMLMMMMMLMISSPDRVKSLQNYLKKHNVYFGKFIISRKWKEHKMLTFDLLNRVVGGWDEDKVRLEKTSLKSRFKRTRRKEEQCTQRREKEASRELAGDGDKKKGLHLRARCAKLGSILVLPTHHDGLRILSLFLITRACIPITYTRPILPSQPSSNCSRYLSEER